MSGKPRHKLINPADRECSPCTADCPVCAESGNQPEKGAMPDISPKATVDLPRQHPVEQVREMLKGAGIHDPMEDLPIIPVALTPAPQVEFTQDFLKLCLTWHQLGQWIEEGKVSAPAPQPMSEQSKHYIVTATDEERKIDCCGDRGGPVYVAFRCSCGKLLCRSEMESHAMDVLMEGSRCA